MRAVDLFCGCGGMSLGFQRSGIEVVAAYENWDDAIECYRNNFLNPVNKMDLSNTENAIAVIRALNIDLIIGGPPCQDFSAAGNRNEGERANLTFAFAQIVKGVAPKYFVMENVARAASSNAYAKARALLIENGYGLTERVLDASFYGVPQKRKRFFCIGVKNGCEDALSNLISYEQTILPLSIRQYFENNNLELPFEYYYRHPRTYGRRGVFAVDNPAPTIRGVNRPKPATYKIHKNDACDPKYVRAMTAPERACVQTFPADFTWPEGSAVTEQLIGNAVPVVLAQHIGRCVLAYDNGERRDNDTRFTEWLQRQKHYTSRAACDVLSRVRRVNRIIPIEQYLAKDACDMLQEQEIYKHTSSSVRSQLKRAIHLFSEYKEDKE